MELSLTKQDNIAQFRAFQPRKKKQAWEPIDDIQDKLESETTREDREREILLNQTL